MPGLGYAPTSGRLAAAKSTALPPGPTSSSALVASPFAVCYVSPKGNSAARNNHNGFIGGSTNNADNKNEKPKLDPSDPRVKKAVYNMYRDMLTSRNAEANDFISKKDPVSVTQDSGVQPILESIIIRQRGSLGGGGDSPGGSAADNSTEGGTTNGTSTMAPPPPPPPMMPGAIPAVRLNSEIGPRDRGPTAALAGAMMKDKKPFTYTPGGIDLSEIRSPRMAKRIQMNAAAEGVTNTTTPSSSSGNQEWAPCQLPPAALAAMQPQMAFPVFPQGNANTKQLNKMHKPADYAGPPPPPPPQPQPMSVPIMRQPPTSPPASQLSPQPHQSLQQPVSPTMPRSPPPPRTPPPPPERAATPKSPLPSGDSYFGNSQASNVEERRSPLGRKSPAVESAAGVGTGALFIPPVQIAPQQQSSPSPSPGAPKSPSPISTYVPPSARPAGQTKAQAVSQNIGSLYIPPIGGQGQQSSIGSAANGNANASKVPQSQPTPPSASAVPSTLQLNKAPIPWMNSYNRMQNQQADSPPYVHPGFFMPPWGLGPPGTRTIPIMMGRDFDQPDSGGGPPMNSPPFQAGGTESRRSSSGSSTPSGSRTPSQAAAHLGRVIPIQIEKEETGRAKGAKFIPIQIEGRPPRVQTPGTPTTPGMNPMRRVAGPPPYNSPMGLYSNQNAMDAYQRQAAEAAAGVDKMNVRCESPRTEPMQSKSMRVIQQAAENELKRIEQEQQQRRMDLSEDDRHLMNLFTSQVHEGPSLHQTAEPRFMGGHIPSKAFRALQTALPASPGADVQPPPSFPASGGPVTHHIPIRQAVSPTPPHSQSGEFQLSSQQQANVPPSERIVQEPRKYMGSNIPSRSFKILQQMTADDGSGGDHPAVDSVEETALEQNMAESYTDDVDDIYSRSSGENLLFPYPYSLGFYPLSPSCSSEGGGSATLDPSANNCNNSNNDNSCNVDDGSSSWPDNQQQQQGWDDPYTYMWYYWWYYSSCYWQGYDMTGYEYPPGWDPNYPYCPPEFSDYSTLSEHYSTAGSGTDLQKSCSERANVGGVYYGEEEQIQDDDKSNEDEDNGRKSVSPGTGRAPRIVIENGDRSIGVDSIKDNDSSSRNNNKVPSLSPALTECNEKPGNLPTIPYKRNDCDKSMNAWTENNNQARDESAEDNDSSSEDEFESCCEDPEQRVIERETGPCNSKPSLASQNFASHLGESGERKSDLSNVIYNSEPNANDHDGEKRSRTEDENRDEYDDEKTDPEDNDDEYGGYGRKEAIIEEPETASSTDDSDATILGNEDGQRCGKPSYYGSSGLSIEEYHSEESSESTVFDYGWENRLSTIDEITESRASSSLLSFKSCGSSATLKNESVIKNTDGSLTSMLVRKNNTEAESEDSEQSSDELSSVSVIENKSDATRGTTESKREGETTSTSDEEDSSTDDDDENEEKGGGHYEIGNDHNDEEDEDLDGTDTAVTVRLPLKLSFTKTKSYRDITTVMVCDSEIGESSQITISSSSSNEDEPKAIKKSGENLNDNDEDGEDGNEEPVVSFTLSLSRQTSREDDKKMKKTINTDCVEEKEGQEIDPDDIDFWAEITKHERAEGNSFKRSCTFYENGSEKTENVESNDESKTTQKENYEADATGGDEADTGYFWGVITRDRSASNFVRRRNKGKQENESCSSEAWNPSESIDYKWEEDFNFWEKSLRTIETKRFSGNFEITEDYESDTGLTPSTEKKERVKKYTHHKRHSIPGPCGVWDSRYSLPPRPVPKQITNFKNLHSELNKSAQEIKSEQEESDDVSNKSRKGAEVEKETRSESLSASQTTDTIDVDASSWWSYWDETSKEDKKKLEIDEDDVYTTEASSTASNVTVFTHKVMESGGAAFSEEKSNQKQRKQENASVENIFVRTNLLEMKGKEETNTGKSPSKEEDYQSFGSSTCVQASRLERRESGDDSFQIKNRDSGSERKSLNYSCQSDATDNEDYSSSSPEIKSSTLPFPSSSNQEEAATAEKLNQQGFSSILVSDENSDESSRSSGTTIGRHDKNEINHQQQILPTEVEQRISSERKADSESHLIGSKERDEQEAHSSTFFSSINDTIEIPVTVERNVEIQHEPAKSEEEIKLNERQQQYQEDHHQVHHHHHHHHHSSAITATSNSTTSETTCTCLMGDRIARAENLLWRIERFLYESLSLGSEDDSGVMTDLSRQISDVDTDVDNDLNDTELLTAATATTAKEKKGVAFYTPPNATTPEPSQHIESCNFAETISSTDPPPLQSSSLLCQQQPLSSLNINSTSATPVHCNQQHVKRPRPKSDIFLESTVKVEMDESTVSTSATVEENQANSGVKMRSASERRALRYQRAKTHSRLFQLLQDECGRDEDEYDYESDVGTLTSHNHNSNNNSDSTTSKVCQISVDTGGILHYQEEENKQHHYQEGIDDDGNGDHNEKCAATSPTSMNDTQARRSRLLPLPIKNLLASSLSFDSTSSPSGSSGVLSPTSPVRRDQLISDIISEFHSRNQTSTVRAQSHRRLSFPSKIFKLLQQRFGEEFYETFDTGMIGEDSLISPSISTNRCMNDQTCPMAEDAFASSPVVHECTIHKSESMKEFEEATNRILTNFMVRNSSSPSTMKAKAPPESPISTATPVSSTLLEEDSKHGFVEFLDVPMRRRKENLNRDARSPKSTKKVLKTTHKEKLQNCL